VAFWRSKRRRKAAGRPKAGDLAPDLGPAETAASGSECGCCLADCGALTLAVLALTAGAVRRARRR